MNIPFISDIMKWSGTGIIYFIIKNNYLTLITAN
jgi:hypothetical protein